MSRPNTSPQLAMLLIAAGVLLSGCSGDVVVPQSPEQPPTAFSLEGTFEERNGIPLSKAVSELGMSPETHEVYVGAIDRGYVLASDVLAVLPEFAMCVAPLGFDVENDAAADGFFGLPNTSWSVVVPNGHEMTAIDDAAIESCADRTIGPIETAFYNQPFSPEREEAWASDTRRDDARTCIEAAGYFVPADAPMQQYIDIAKEIVSEVGYTECLDLVLNGSPDG